MIFAELTFFVAALLLLLANVVVGLDWCFCTIQSTDTPLVAWEYNTTDCFLCEFEGNATSVGCTNYTKHAHAALTGGRVATWGVSTSVSCSSSLAAWTAASAIEASVNGVDVRCNETECCCPTGSFQLADVTATSMHLTTGLAGQCGNKTSFDAAVPLEQLGHTYLEVKAGAWPFSGNYLHVTADRVFLVGSDLTDCQFVVGAGGGGIGPGGIAAIVIILLLVVLGAAAYFLWRRRRGADSYQTV